jgi:imidazolonepropionase-like amidohydrolase
VRFPAVQEEFVKLLRIFIAALLLTGLMNAAAMAQTAGRNTLALAGATIYAAPDAPPIANGTVLVENGKITFVGKQEQANLPRGIYIINCPGMIVTAGFQNSHVHFTEPKWSNAARLPAAQLTRQLQEMLTRYGFTTVVDTGSDPHDTIALRKRIDSGEVLGPRILTAGAPLYPKNGIPYYLSDLPPETLKQLQQPATPKEAAADAGRMLDLGADIIKLFTGSWISHSQVLPMDPKIAAAASAVAHRRGALVFAHMSNVAGLEVALQAHVDVAAHAIENTQELTTSHLERMKAAHMALIPTLYLFGGNDQMDTGHLPILKEVGDYSRMGGQILFGTDVGYLPQYDPVYEYKFMQRAGLDFPQVLASLTTAPAERFKERNRGRVAPGMDADLVVLGSDPAVDITSFTDVRYTIRAGRVIYSSVASPVTN